MNISNILSSTFTNRELAIVLWLIPTIAVLMTIEKIRKSIIQVFRSFFHIKISGLFLLFAGYLSVIVFLLNLAGFWEKALLKPWIMWFLFSGIALAMETFAAKKDSPFKGILIDNLKVWIVIEFVASTFTFSLVGELIFIPIIFFTALVAGVSSTDKSYSQVHAIFTWLLVIIGVGVLASGVVEIVQNFSDYAKWITIKEFSLAPILSITSIPFFYLTMLYMQYESMFVRLQYSEAKRAGFIRLQYSEAKRAGFIREAKCATIRYAKISYKKIRSIKGLKMAKLLRADSLSEFNKYLRMSASDSGMESETE